MKAPKPHKKTSVPALPVGTGRLQKGGGAYTISFESAAAIDALLALQDIVYADLADSEKAFIMPKTRAALEKHFAAGNAVVAVRVNGDIVAQALIVNPTRKNPKTGMTDMPGCPSPEKVTVIQGVLVHPAYRGNRLMTKMVDVWLENARLQGRQHALAEVAADNAFSWSVFMREGLALDSIGYDKDDMIHLYNMKANVKQLLKQRLNTSFNDASRDNRKAVACAETDIDKQKKLLGKKFKGVAYQAETKQIIFTPSKTTPAKKILSVIKKCFR